MPPKIIYRDELAKPGSTTVDGDGLWLSLSDLTAATGWKLKPEGACLEEICIPLPDGQRGRFLRGDGAETRFNLAALANHVGQPVIHDAKHDLWYFGTEWAGGEGPSTRTAPDFTLPDTEGRMHSLSDQRGKKVLLATWASW